MENSRPDSKCTGVNGILLTSSDLESGEPQSFAYFRASLVLLWFKELSGYKRRLRPSLYQVALRNRLFISGVNLALPNAIEEIKSINRVLG